MAPADPVADAVKDRFRQRFSGMDVTAVRRTPYGLFEVQLGMDLIYTDEKVTWVMEGPLIDAMTRRDVTRESQEKLSAVTFDQLPLDLAIKQVRATARARSRSSRIRTAAIASSCARPWNRWTT